MNREREKGFEPSTSTLAIRPRPVSSCSYPLRIIRKALPGVTRATQPLRESGAPSGAHASEYHSALSVSLYDRPGWARIGRDMVQSAPPPFEEEAGESPAKRLVRLLERHGLEDSLRDILQSLEVRRQSNQGVITAALI